MPYNEGQPTGADANPGTQTPGDDSSNVSSNAGESTTQNADIDKLVNEKVTAILNKTLKPKAEKLATRLLSERIDGGLHEAGYEGSFEDLLLELKEGKLGSKSESDRVKLEAKRQAEEAKKWREKAEALELKQKKTEEERTILRIATDEGAVDPNDVLDIVVNRGNQDIRDMDGNLDEAAVKGYIVDLLNRKKHLMKPRGTPGAGSRPGFENNHQNQTVDFSKDAMARRDFLRKAFEP